MNKPWTVAVVASVCLHLFFIAHLPGGRQRQILAIKTTSPPPPPLMVSLVPSPARLVASAPAALPKQAPAQKPASLAKQPAIAQRASLLSPKPAPPPPTTTEAPPLEVPQVSTTIAPAPAAGQTQPLNLALPQRARNSFAGFDANTGQASANSLRRRIQSHIEAERMQKSAPAPKDSTAPTRIAEQVNTDGSRQARVDSSWGSYCLSSPRHHVAGDPRMPTNTVVPTTCP